MPGTVIKVENLGKLYRLGEVGTGTISHDLNRWWANLRGKEDPFSKVGTLNDRTQKTWKGEHVWALKGINFEVEQGEILGIIGKNGAGKSTLLKLLSKITSPTAGSISIKGRVASLLEVGTGFHPEMTGRENVYMNGTVLGMTKKEITKKLDDIIDFAGVAKYLDTPIKRYSSGMKVRLAFAVAAFLEPEILVVDEVLAVGDAEFQKRAIGKMQEISKGGNRTVLFVSHNMESITRLCSKILILKNGTKDYEGGVLNGINRYLQSSVFTAQQVVLERQDRIGGVAVRLAGVEFYDEERNPIDMAISGLGLVVSLDYLVQSKVENLVFRLIFRDDKEIIRFVCNNYHSSEPFKNLPENGRVNCFIPNLPLPPGNFFINVTCVSLGRGTLDSVDNAAKLAVDAGDFFGTGKIPEIREGVLVKHQWYT